MTDKQWIALVLGFTFFPMLILCLLNYIVDPYNIFHSNFLPKPYEMNERFNKIRFLDSNYQHYDSYIMGSSRSGTTSPEILEKYLPNSHFYNFTVAGSTQYDNALILRYLLKRKYPIKNIYLQIDISDIYGFKPLENNYNAKHHPHVTNGSKTKFYLSYLTILPLRHLKNKVKINYFSPHDAYMYYDLEKTGRWFVNGLEEKIRKDPEAYIQNEPSFNTIRLQRNIKGTKIQQNIQALFDVIQLAKKHQINLIVYIAPHNHHLMNTFHVKSYLEYLQKISLLTNFWDFSGYNHITNNNRNYYESSHYRENIARLIAKEIFESDPKASKSNHFGHYVTSSEINEYLLAKEKEMLEHDNILALHFP